MTAHELFDWMESMNPSPYTPEQKILWLNDLESALWTEVFLQPAGLWKPRTAEEGDRPLLLPESRRMLYAMYLWAMMDFARGEYGAYGNAMELYNRNLAQLQCWYAENYAPAMTAAVWTEWIPAAYDGTGAARFVLTLPPGCALLGAECEITEAGELESLSLGTERDPEAILPAVSVDPAAGAARCLRFMECTERAVYAHGTGSGEVKFRLLLQPGVRAMGKTASGGAALSCGAKGPVAYGVRGPAGVNGTDGTDGKSAYAYAREAGYTGTEAEFAAKLAEENTGIHIGPEAPADDSVLWVDTDEEEAPAAVTPDWNASEGEPGHVLNRTHYKGVVELLPETTLAYDDTQNGYRIDGFIPVVGETYTVTWNGADYTCTCVGYTQEGVTFPCLGNLGAVDETQEDTGEPFVIMYAGVTVSLPLDGATEAPMVRIAGPGIVTIPYDYLPPLSYVIDVEDVTTSSGNKFANMIYDTTELVQFLKNGWPVWLNITGGSIDKRVQVTAWSTLGMSIDEQIAQGVSPAAVVLFLCGKELGLATEYKWTVGLNVSD